MILEIMFSLFCDFLEFLFRLVDMTFIAVPGWFVNYNVLILKGLAFFPFEIWSTLVANFLAWTVVHFAWAVIEWLYHKIPFASIT